MCLGFSPVTGRPAIAYADGGDEERGYFDHIEFAEFNGTAWTIRVADDQTESEYWDRITFELDTSGNPHLAYYAPESDIRGLRHADRSSGGTWTQGTILPGRSLRRPESVNFGSNRFGLAFIDAYWSDDDYEGIYYVEYSGGHWGTPNGIIPGGMDRKSMSIAIAPQTVAGYAAAGQPAVAFIEYQEGGGESLKYAYRDATCYLMLHDDLTRSTTSRMLRSGADRRNVTIARTSSELSSPDATCVPT